MILPFSTQLNGKPTMFTNRIVKSMWQYYPSQIRQHALTVPLPDHYVFEDLTVFQEEKLSPKIHTIRTDEKDRWKPGILIDFFINCRQKNMFRFAPRVAVVSTQKLKLFFITDAPYCYNAPAVYIDDKFITGETLLQLAQNDGFDTVEAFFEYFNEDYVGKIIHWTNFKY